MSDVTAAPPAPAAAPASGIQLPGLGDLGAFLRRGDIALAIGVLTSLVVLILPLPPILLDLFLAISIILAVLILTTSLFNRRRSNSPRSRPCC
jgi:flagellar biosynthesis protein FlhA